MMYNEGRIVSSHPGLFFPEMPGGYGNVDEIGDLKAFLDGRVEEARSRQGEEVDRSFKRGSAF